MNSLALRDPLTLSLPSSADNVVDASSRLHVPAVGVKSTVVSWEPLIDSSLVQRAGEDYVISLVRREMVEQTSVVQTASLKAQPHQQMSVLRLPTRERLSRFKSLQKWEGVVTDVLEDSFTARVHDLTRRGLEEEAEFFKDEISQDDLGLIQPGAVFYWNIGYYDSKSGQRTRQSLIRFRRLPGLSKSQLNRARLEAQRFASSIEWK